jgi:hypothetical protein
MYDTQMQSWSVGFQTIGCSRASLSIRPANSTSCCLVANLQHQFAMIRGGKPREIGLPLYLLCLFMGRPLFLLLGPGWRARRVSRRLERTQNNLMQDLAPIRGIIYAGCYRN